VSPWFSDALLRAQSDDRLVMLARAGHERAFVAIVERYRRPLYAFTRRLVPEARAEDVLQQAFTNAWAALSGGADVRHLRAWLHQIVRNAAIAAVRPAGDEPLSELLVGADGPERDVELRLLVSETLDNIARLPEHQRAAIVKTAMEGRSRSEVASSLGVTDGAVRALLHRARTTLRAAATALTPMPLATWAAGGRGPGLEHAAELVAGAGSASIAGATAKTGTIVAVTGAVAGSLASHGTPLPGHHPQHHRRAVIAGHHHRATAPVRLPAPHAGPAATTAGTAPAHAAPAAGPPRPAPPPTRDRSASAPHGLAVVVRRSDEDGGHGRRHRSAALRAPRDDADDAPLRAPPGDDADEGGDGDDDTTAMTAQTPEADDGDDRGGGDDGLDQPDPASATASDD
jgi:RNA polymerase sigma factor (sigma-70 family)